MSKSKFNPLITASVMSAVYLAGLSNVSQAVELNLDVTDAPNSLTAVYNQNNNAYIPPANELGQRRYIIRLSEPAVARYNGTGSFAAIPRKADRKIDTASPAVNTYVAHLKQQQNSFLSNLSGQFNRSVNSIFDYQYALNGVVVELTIDEAKAIQSMPEVEGMELDKAYSLDTDAGPTLIGANNVWTGTSPASGTAFGEGVVVGVLDSGANFDHPSFADVGDDGYDHTNPLGAGNFLGVCDPGNASQFDAAYTCNDKIIGGYDFVNAITPATGFDIPGPEDENGHGTHTASTAAGNLVNDAEANGVTGIEVSGVARHANLVIFDVCYNPGPGEGGGCFGSAAAESIDQILADGIVDAINYSISGGTSPWTEAASLAFLSASDSGVFVSASAGNSGPGPGTLGHLEPWTASVGASTHDREFSNLLSITAPAPDPSVTDISYNNSNGPSAVAVITATINYSEIVDPANLEGCNPFPPASFATQVALISRGACSFEQKVNNASDAGAIAVVIHNNAPGGLLMNVGTTTTIPSFSVEQVEGQAMAANILANPGATVQIELPAISPGTGQADVMAGFSSRGPSTFEYNKPDVTGPGVNILAGFADTDPSIGTPAEYGIISGTSMSSPHNAGAAALLKELNPTWSPAEIKSALMLTAVTAGVTKEDAITPADPFDRGAGRIQVDVASSTGFVMDETAFRFLLADPSTGGDPKTLNVASYKNDDCVGTCSFQRKFRSVAAGPVDYTASLTGMTGTVSPATFTANPGQTVTLDIDIDGGALPAGATSFGELVINEVPSSFAPAGTFNLAAAVVIDDNAYVSPGLIADMNCGNIEVTGISGSVFSAEMELGIDHTWAGDLTVKLVNPNGDVLTMTNEEGSGNDLIVTSPISFFDGAPVDTTAMGATLDPFAGEFICQDDAVCEFTATPGAEASPPANFADMGVGSANGTWQVCAGDSAGGDTGQITTAALTVLEGVTTVPGLHLPLVVIGFPEAPDIDVTPTSLTATQDPDTTTDLNLNIANSPLAGADLNWTFGSGTFANVFAEQAVNGTQGIVSDFWTPEATGVYSSDDFTLASDASIETMFFGGFVNNQTLADIGTSVEVRIFGDAAGVPDGHPEDGNPALVELSIPIADPSLDLTDNNIGIDVVAANGSAVDLPSGTYWVVAYVVNSAGFGVTDRWNWFAGVTTDSTLAVLIDPSDLFGGMFTDWVDLVALTGEATLAGLNYSLSGQATCGASWITTSVAGGVVIPGGDEDVTVTLDSAGLTPGDYSALLCVDSDDPDEARVLVPVTMTVDGPSDVIFADGFDTPPAP